MIGDPKWRYYEIYNRILEHLPCIYRTAQTTLPISDKDDPKVQDAIRSALISIYSFGYDIVPRKDCIDCHNALGTSWCRCERCCSALDTLGPRCETCMQIHIRLTKLEKIRSNQFEFQLAQLRHLYHQMVDGHVKDTKRAAESLLGPAIEFFEKMSRK